MTSNVTKYNASNPADCKNGAEILVYANRRGLINARLVRDIPFGWFLVGDGPDSCLPSQIAQDLQVTYGGGSTNWHQISPEKYSDPQIRSVEMLNAAERFVTNPEAQHSQRWDLVLSDAGDVTTIDGFVIRPKDEWSEGIAKAVYARLEVSEVDESVTAVDSPR